MCMNKSGGQSRIRTCNVSYVTGLRPARFTNLHIYPKFMAQITGIEPISMVLETTVLPLNYICITGALDGIRTHTPKALPPEDSVSTYFTTRALKWLGRLDSNQGNARFRVWCLTTWLHPNKNMADSEGLEPSTKRLTAVCSTY